MICETCRSVFSTDIFTVPPHPNHTTKYDACVGLWGLSHMFPEDGQVYFVPHLSSLGKINKSAKQPKLGCECCAWLLELDNHLLQQSRSVWSGERHIISRSPAL